MLSGIKTSLISALDSFALIFKFPEPDRTLAIQVSTQKREELRWLRFKDLACN